MQKYQLSEKEPKNVLGSTFSVYFSESGEYIGNCNIGKIFASKKQYKIEFANFIRNFKNKTIKPRSAKSFNRNFARPLRRTGRLVGSL